MTASAPESIQQELAAAIDAAPPGSVADHCLIELPASEPPWLDTGLALSAGDVVTIVRHGRISLGDSELWLPSGFNVWARVGGRGPLERGTRPSHTFVAPRNGNLELGNAQPAEWTDQDGAIADDPAIYALMAGHSTVLAIRWSPGTDPTECLRAMGDRTSGNLACYFGGEADRLQGNPGIPPEGWEHLWYVGPSEVFSRDTHGFANHFRPLLEDAVRALADVLRCDPREFLVPHGKSNRQFGVRPSFRTHPKVNKIVPIERCQQQRCRHSEIHEQSVGLAFCIEMWHLVFPH